MSQPALQRFNKQRIQESSLTLTVLHWKPRPYYCCDVMIWSRGQLVLIMQCDIGARGPRLYPDKTRQENLKNGYVFTLTSLPNITTIIQPWIFNIIRFVFDSCSERHEFNTQIPIVYYWKSTLKSMTGCEGYVFFVTTTNI